MTNTETWNGSSWTEVNDLNTGRHVDGGAGTTTSALIGGGEGASGDSIDTESWNGSSWTEVGDLNVATGGAASTGSSNTAAVVFGGQGPSVPSDRIQVWNGSSWVMGNNMNTARHDLCGAGNSSTSSLAFGGRSSPPTWFTATEEWYGDGHVTEKISSS